jgi:hypothetical protein
MDEIGDWQDFSPDDQPFTFKDVQDKHDEEECQGILVWGEFLRLIGKKGKK